MLIPSALEISSDVLTAAAAMAGLVLIFLGAVVARYLSIPGIMRDTKVRERYRRRAWFIFTGFVLAVAAGLLALFGKWFQSEQLVRAAIVSLVLSAIWTIVAAVRMVREIDK